LSHFSRVVFWGLHAWCLSLRCDCIVFLPDLILVIHLFFGLNFYVWPHNTFVHFINLVDAVIFHQSVNVKMSLVVWYILLSGTFCFLVHFVVYIVHCIFIFGSYFHTYLGLRERLCGERDLVSSLTWERNCG
jgi:hypothetical protein